MEYVLKITAMFYISDKISTEQRSITMTKKLICVAFSHVRIYVFRILFFQASMGIYREILWLIQVNEPQYALF